MGVLKKVLKSFIVKFGGIFGSYGDYPLFKLLMDRTVS